MQDGPALSSVYCRRSKLARITAAGEELLIFRDVAVDGPFIPLQMIRVIGTSVATVIRVKGISRYPWANDGRRKERRWQGDSVCR